jgi:hypothetical protein
MWDMHFEIGETKELYVSYSVPFTTVGGTSNISRRFGNYDKEWYAKLENCLIESFRYTTDTIKSWKNGYVDEAVFEIRVRDFESYLNQRSIIESESKSVIDKYANEYGVLRPSVYRVLKPDGWRESIDGTIKWHYDKYQGNSPIALEYYMLCMPSTIEDARRLVTMLFKNTSTVEDRVDLVNIIKAYYGHEFDTPRIKSYLENQIWYPAKRKYSIKDDIVNEILRNNAMLDQRPVLDQRP